MSVETLRWAVMACSLVSCAGSFVLVGSAFALQRRVRQRLAEIGQLRDELSQVLVELKQVEAYAIAVGGKPVADELNRLAAVANETARMAVKRRVRKL